MNQREDTAPLIQAMQTLISQGLASGTAGNASVRSGQGFLITPTGVRPEDLKSEKLVYLNYEGKVINGDYLPSSEWQMHAKLYQHRPDINALVHCHSRYATSLACRHRDIPPFHYMVAVAGGNSIRCARYALFGSEQLANTALSAFEERYACLLANHGQLAAGKNIGKALELAIEVEQLSEIYHTALSTGDCKLLSEGDMHSVLKKFKSYGQL